MLFVKHNFGYVYMHKGIFLHWTFGFFMMRPLRAQSCFWQKRKRASRLGSCRASLTVEAALALPIFLCACCALILMGQRLAAEAELYAAVAGTAEAVAGYGESDTAGKTVEAQVIFSTLYQDSELCARHISGGRAGILLLATDGAEEGTVQVRATYRLKLSLPYFTRTGGIRQVTAVRRRFTGYVGDGDGSGGVDGSTVVYMAKNGTVYHTSMTCSHICLKITGAAALKKEAKKRGLRPCEKCVGEDAGGVSSGYITAYGDCYHSSLSCSGLKRSIRAVKRSELKGVRECSKCAGN